MQYFKHHTKMRNDVKIKRLIGRYGLEGYGLYVLVLETIAGELSTESPLPILEETCEDIAAFYNCNSAKIDEMIRFMIDQELFEVDLITHKLACYKIYKYLEQSQTRSEKIRQLIEAYRNSSESKALPDLSQSVSDKYDRTEQKRTEQTKKRKEEKKDDKGADAHRLFSLYYDKYQSEYGAPPSVTAPKAMSVLKARLATCSLDELASMLADTWGDAYLKANGHGFGLVFSDVAIAKWRAGNRQAADLSKLNV